MNNNTTKILWVLISIIIFSLAVMGTLILVLTNKEDVAVVIDKSPKTPLTTTLDPSLLVPTSEQNMEVNITINNPEQDTLLPSFEPNVTPETTPDNQSQLLLEEKKQTSQEREIRIVPKSENQPAQIISSKKKTKSPPKLDVTPSNQVRFPVQPPKKQPTLKATQKKEPVYVHYYWIQIGSYALLSGAESKKATLKEKGFKTIITTKEVNKKIYYRLRIGPFETKKEADHYLEQLKKDEPYKDSYVSKTTSTMK